MNTADLKAALRTERLDSYRRLKGGYPVPLAGAVYWLMLTWAGYQFDRVTWLNIAMAASGLIFPLALLLAKLLRCPFMKDRTAVSDVMLPTFISMLLFWPMMIPVVYVAPWLGPLMLAIGMSLHWPVIGWTYGRTALFTSHAVVRAIAALVITIGFPQHNFTLLPLSVAIIYLVTVAAILIDLRPARQRPMLAAA